MNRIDQKRLEEILLLEKELHPKAEVRDYYKLFYQSIYGPAHLLSPISKAKKDLENELAYLKENNEINFQDISISRNLDFIRVNLNFIKRNNITLDSLFNVLIESASLSPKFNKLTFKRYLNDFWEVISLIFKDLNGYNKQVFELKQILNQGDYILHHSKTYRETYNPHYRVVSKRIWNKHFKHLFFMD